MRANPIEYLNHNLPCTNIYADILNLPVGLRIIRMNSDLFDNFYENIIHYVKLDI